MNMLEVAVWLVAMFTRTLRKGREATNILETHKNSHVAIYQVVVMFHTLFSSAEIELKGASAV